MQKAKKVKVTLTGPHTHRRERLGKDDEIEVRPDQAKRIVDAGRGKVSPDVQKQLAALDEEKAPERDNA